MFLQGNEKFEVGGGVNFVFTKSFFQKTQVTIMALLLISAGILIGNIMKKTDGVKEIVTYDFGDAKLAKHFLKKLGDYNNAYVAGLEGGQKDLYYWQDSTGIFRAVQCNSDSENWCCEEGTFNYETKTLIEKYKTCDQKGN